MALPHDKPTPPTAAAETPKAPRGLSRGLVRLGVALTGVIVLGGAGAWYFLAPKARTQSDRLAQSLKLIDEGQPEEARKLAQALKVQRYRDPEFAGGVEFALGMTAFQQAESADKDEQKPLYSIAATDLREAESQGLADVRRPAWCFALGKTLYALNDLVDARPLLEEAVTSYPQQRVVAAVMEICERSAAL